MLRRDKQGLQEEGAPVRKVCNGPVCGEDALAAEGLVHAHVARNHRGGVARRRHAARDRHGLRLQFQHSVGHHPYLKPHRLLPVPRIRAMRGVRCSRRPRTPTVPADLHPVDGVGAARVGRSQGDEHTLVLQDDGLVKVLGTKRGIWPGNVARYGLWTLGRASVCEAGAAACAVNAV